MPGISRNAISRGSAGFVSMSKIDRPGAERLAIRQRVGERVLEVVARVVVRLHAHDVGAVREQHEPFGDLQVMRARVRRRREEVERLQLARIARVEHRDAVAEHVADVEMAAVQHDLHAVGPAALIAVRQVPESRRRCLRAGCRRRRRRAASAAAPRSRPRRRARPSARAAFACRVRGQFGRQVSQVRKICPAILSGSAPGNGSNFCTRPAKQSARYRLPS